MNKVQYILSLWYYILGDITKEIVELLNSIAIHYAPEPPLDISDKGNLNLFDLLLLGTYEGGKIMAGLLRKGLVAYRKGMIIGGKALIAYSKKKRREKKQRQGVG
ncbi:hypothetical protein LCGC14_0347990 [marine sediment metagenome]|uniref:Uncharacterized protein n=1 Tax=marine sediment metagenome TaxID=412755 RepID=A0A0F9TUT5_9ZZZZ